MNYELAKELMDAGFPQNIVSGSYLISPDEKKHYIEIKGYADLKSPDTMVYIPTLSELIAACGDEFIELSKYPKMWNAKGGWEGDKECMSPKHDIEAPTPEIAVAKLWLALNRKV